jgi:hypothetical protein
MPVVVNLKGLPSNKQKIGDQGEKGEGGKVGKVIVSDICYSPVPGRVAVLKPFIDKITILSKIGDPIAKKALIQGFNGDAEDGGKYSSASTFKTGNVSYESSVLLAVPASGHRVLIQVGPKKKDTAHDLRLEFNPAALGEAGMAYLKYELENQVVGALDFKHIMETGSVSRVDIAVDVVGIRIDALDIRYLGKGKSHWYFSASGEPETGYYGISPTPKGKKNAPFVTYNKRKQLKETGSSGDDELYNGLSHTRIEYHATPFKKFGQLKTIPNPFKEISLAYPRQPKGVSLHAWQFFMDACHRRGHQTAIARLPTENMKKRYNNALEAAHQRFWKPDLIWTQWLAVIEGSGLLEN